MTAAAPPPGKLWSVVTWLEMTEPPPDAADPTPPAGAGDLDLRPVRGMGVADYRALYRAVGEPWLWWERLVVPDDRLAAEIDHPDVEIRRLSRNGVLAGYSELDRRRAGEVKIAYFGLTPACIGRGLGRWLMARTLGAAWAGRPRRVWLHTCTEDHPSALGFYRRMGFRPCGTEAGWIDDPRLSGLLPRHVAPHVPLAG